MIEKSALIEISIASLRKEDIVEMVCLCKCLEFAC
jgi:hypothetical protein